MQDYICITSVYTGGQMFSPNAIVQLDEATAEHLGQSVELSAKPAAAPAEVEDAQADTEADRPTRKTRKA